MINKISNLSMFFFTNYFMNSVINSTHSEWSIEFNYTKNWSKGNSVKISLVNQRIGAQFLEGRWVGGRWVDKSKEVLHKKE